MNPDRWRRVQEIVENALDLTGTAQYHYLGKACTQEPTLRAEVDKLLAVDADDMDFMERPVIQLETDDAKIPQRVGPYQIIRELGRGGMGAVYLARREGDAVGKDVALKILKRGMDTDALIRRFQNERKILASLNHAGIAGLIEGAATEDGRPYFVMEYVDGAPITQWCDQRKLSLEARIALFRKVCHVVHFAHRNLVIHRDIKPSNILVTADGEPKLLDFGIARLTSHNADTTQFYTNDSNRLLTPDYASPEQIAGAPLTTATDIYSLGLLLYEMLTGRRPTRSQTTGGEMRANTLTRLSKPSAVVLQAHTRKTGETISAEELSAIRALDPKTLRRRLSGDLDTIVLHALRFEPECRYASVEQFEEDLARYQGHYPILARPESLVYSMRKLVGRHPLATSGMCATLLAALLLLGLLLQQRMEAQLANRRGDTLNEVMFTMLSYVDGYVAENGKVPVSDFLDHTFNSMRTLMDEEPLLQAEALDTLGVNLLRAGDLNTGRVALQRARMLWERHGDPNHLRGAWILNHNAQALEKLEEYGAAADLFQQALNLFRNLDNAQGMADSMTGLGLCAFFEQRHEDANTWFTQARAIWDTLPMSEDQAKALNFHAENLIELNRIDDAEDLLVKAQDYFLATSTHHVLYAETLAIQAYSAFRRPDVRTAIMLWEQSLALLDSLVDDQSPELGIVMNNLALAYERQADYPKAIQLLQRSLKIIAHQYAPNSRTNLIVSTKLARNYNWMGQTQQAYDLLAAIPLDDQTPDYFHYVMVVYKGQFLADLGRDAEAEALLLQAVAEFENLAKPPKSSVIYWGLSQFYVDRNRPAEALPYIEKLNTFYKSRPAPMLANHALQARLFATMGRQAEAEALHRRILADYNTLPEKNGHFAAEAHRQMARTYQYMGRYQQALAYCNQAIAIWQSLPGIDHNLEGASALKAELLKALGRHDEGSQILEDISQRRETIEATMSNLKSP